jgi:hypothetical protein
MYDRLISTVFKTLFDHPRHVECWYSDTHEYVNVPSDGIPVIPESNNPWRMQMLVVRMDGKTYYVACRYPEDNRLPPSVYGDSGYEINEGTQQMSHMRRLESNDPVYSKVIDWLYDFVESYQPAPANWIGETPVALEDSPYKDWDSIRLAMYYIESYGQIDGAHHRAWVLDQVAKVLKGGQIVNLRKAEWTDHPPEYRFDVSETQEYLDWVKAMKGEDEEEYDYDHGIAP